MRVDIRFVNLSITLIVILSVASINAQYYYGNETVFDDTEEFDFVIVGAGPSGSVLANRLSENPAWKILLIEAGGSPIFLIDFPFLASAWQFTNYGWAYKSEKSEFSCLACPDQRMWWGRGKGLGGTSIVNFMIAVRGNKIDYDRWAAMGNPGWSYEEVLPYFMKSEDANIAITDPEYHQKGGYLSISDIPFRSEAVKAYIEAAQEAGHPYVDYNGRNQLGVSYVQSTTKNGRRCSAESAFLRPAYGRPNLKILTYSRVVEVLIDPDTKTAYGVKFARNKRYHKALAKKEVILSAGGLNSPQLLMLSGIGPREHLEELGIPVIRDSPVGQKLYDHLTFVGVTYLFNETISFNPATVLIDLPGFLLNGQTQLTTIGGVEALTYIKTEVSKDPEPYPDIELIFIGAALNTDDGASFRQMFSLTQETYDAVWKPIGTGKVCQVFPMLTHPKSFGYLKLKSKNPFHWPKFYPNYLSDPEGEDIRTFLASIREIQRIMSMPAMQRYNATILRTPLPPCSHFEFDTDEYWMCGIRQIGSTLWHQITTCKMGPPNDPEAVVDSNLRVYGVKNLRVVDISIVPLPLTAHTVLPSYMIGEKAADLIKQTWQSKNNLNSEDIRSFDIEANNWQEI